MERETGIEPATSSLGSWRSTAELLPLRLANELSLSPPSRPHNHCTRLVNSCVHSCLNSRPVAQSSFESRELMRSSNSAISRRKFLQSAVTASGSAALYPAFSVGRAVVPAGPAPNVKPFELEREAKGSRCSLHGVPVLIKDNIDTTDRMLTTAGSLALVGSKPPKDSFVAQRLRAAGAVILGKTNLSEWANIRSSHSVSGWSGRGGLTRNPYVLDRNPCGSSSGSGAAVAASLCALAVGTETDGSVVCPSSANGIVGIKPTLGMISRSGIIPIAHSQDTAGPMARTVRD